MGQVGAEEEDQDSWAAQEMLKANLGDKRLNRRVAKVLYQLAQRPEGSVPSAFESWRETLAAYRLFDNEKVSAEKVLEPHRDATLERAQQFPVVLCVQDTTELDFTGRSQLQGLGPLSGKSSLGLHIHPTLAITPDRLCLGVVDQWTWARDAEDHGGKDRQHRLRRSLEEKESLRWVEGYRRVCDWQSTLSQTRLVYVADGDSDLFELFEEGERGEADWLIRASQDRALAEGGLLKATLGEAEILGTLEFDLPASAQRAKRHVVQTLRVARLKLRPPYRPDKKLPVVEVTAILAWEETAPEGVEPIEWLLLTNLEVPSAEDAREKVQWYVCRWQIEVYFRILKSGCRVEELQLQERDRLEVALALYMIIAWRVLYLIMLGRTLPEISCEAVLAPEEWKAVYLVTQKKKPPSQPPALQEMLVLIATLGGFLARKGDGPPGPKALWIGLQRTRDFVLALQAREAVS
ncbi:MAG TPA: IS4 family transposase [Thermoanaerobaculia bacterium]|nr:IS4 family transposase [Thermoanaerobaculia bacterium]